MALCVFRHFIEYLLLFLDDDMDKKCGYFPTQQKFSLRVLLSFCLNFCQFQPSVAYKSVAYKKKRVVNVEVYWPDKIQYSLIFYKKRAILVRIFWHSVQMRENTDQKKLLIWTLSTLCRRLACTFPYSILLWEQIADKIPCSIVIYVMVDCVI